MESEIQRSRYPLELAWLGAPFVKYLDQPLTIRTRKAVALLVYLTTEPGIHTREKLTTLFWPESDSARGRGMLRTSLAHLREAMKAIDSAVLLIEPQTLGFNFNSHFELDLHLLQAGLDALQRQPALAERGMISRQLQRAVDCYRGDFLEGFSLADAPEFDDWARLQREVWHNRMNLIFDTLSQWQFEAGDLRNALETAQRWHAHDFYGESAPHRLMQIHFANGNRADALQVYDDHARMLANEFGGKPSAAINALAARIRTRSTVRQRPEQSPPSLTPADLPFVGRADEFSRLMTAYHTASQGQTQVVILIGETGIGKTRLATEFLHWVTAQGADVLAGRAFETGGGLPYQLVAHLLRHQLEQEKDLTDLLTPTWLAELSRLLPEVRERYPDLPQPQPGEATAQSRLLESITRLGQTIAERAPLVLFIDDIHWADLPSLAALHYAMSRWTQHKTPILLLLCSRDLSSSANHTLRQWVTSLKAGLSVTQVALASLTLEATMALVSSLASGQAVVSNPTQDEGEEDSSAGSIASRNFKAFAQALFAETNGEPLYLVEIIKSLLEQGVLVPYQTAQGTQGLRSNTLASATTGQISLPRIIPNSVRQAILDRLAGLTAAAGILLSAAAAIGEAATFEQITAVSGVDQIAALDALEELLAKRLLVESSHADEIYFVAHDRIRDVVYNESSAVRRKVLHRRAVTALQGGDPTRLAYHFQAAEMDGEAFQASIVARDAALQLVAGQSATLPTEPATKEAGRDSSSPIASPAVHDWGEMPVVGQFHGREQEITTVSGWLQEGPRLVAVLGIGSIGKSALAAQTVRQVADRFEIVIWSSLLNAPPLSEILRHWLQTLSRQTITTLETSLNDQIRTLLELLRQQHCLLILDNVESILHSDAQADAAAGRPRTGYADYEQLLHSLSSEGHRSTLLLTSRELPAVLSRWQGQPATLRVLSLTGLPVQAGQALLQAQGLVPTERTASALVQQYSGNPLALQIISHTILDLYNGDIDAFTQEGFPIFDDIRTVLDQQFGRLSALERELLIWLAIEREPVTATVLRTNLVEKESQRAFLEALRSLQQRSLLEKTDDGFTLQNMVIEYVTEYLVETVYAEVINFDRVNEDGATQRREPPGRRPLRGHAVTVSLLNRHALLKVLSKGHVRQSQARLILEPVSTRLQATLGKEQVSRKIARLLDTLRTEPITSSGYAAGNLLNLLLLLEIDLTGYDFSHLRVWQADLRSARLSGVNFQDADLNHSAFFDGFRMVYAVAYSPDGALVAAGTSEGEVRLWRADNGQPIRTYSGHTGTVKCVTFSPDGKILASGDEGNVVRLWAVGDTQAGVLNMTSLPTVLKGHSGRVTAVAFHPDGKMLASSAVDRTVRLWDLANRETIAVLQGHKHWIWAIAFHPDGKTLASAGFDHSIRLWDVQTARLRVVLEGHTGTVSSLAFDPNGDRLASGSYDRTVRLWDVEGEQILRIMEASADEINCIAFSPDGAQLASGSDDKMTRIWDLRDGAMRHELRGHDDEVLALAYSPNGHTLVTGSGDQTVRLWDASNGRIRQIIFGHSQSVTTVAYHPNGIMLASGAYDGVVRLWDLDGRHIEQTLHGHRQVMRMVAISPDGALLASGSDDQTIHLWDLSEHGRAHRRHFLHGHRGRVWSVAFSPDGTMLASGGLDGMVCLWDVRSGQLLRVLQGHESHVYSVQFSPDGSLLASASSDESICLWDHHNTRPVHRWRGHPNKVYSVAFSPDGNLLASGGGDGLIRVWNIRSPAVPRLEATLDGHSDRVHAVAISVDGSCLVSGSADCTVRMWDLGAYQAIRTLYGHTLWVHSVGISPDGHTIASGGADDAIRLWDRQSGECLSVLTAPGPYAGMNITNVTGITDAEKTTLKLLGAVEV